MSTTAKLITAEELWQMPQQDRRLELVLGELITMSPAGFDHCAVGMRIGIRLGSYVLENRLGIVVNSECGFVLRRNPDTVRAPDVAFVRQDRIPDPRPVKFWEGAPDLAVEVLSPTDTVDEIDGKVEEYLQAGSTEVIVINPQRRMLKVFRQGTICTILQERGILDGLESVPGFRCPVADIFA